MPFSKLSIKSKAILAIIFIFILSYGIVFTIFTLYESHQLKKSLVDQAELLSKNTADYSGSQIFHGHNNEINEALEKLESFEIILYGAIYDYKGELLFTFNPDSLKIQRTIAPDFKSEKSISFDEKHSFIINQPIFYDKICYGSVELRISTLSIKHDLYKLTGLVGIITLLILVLVYILAYFFQRIISNPLLELAEITGKITSTGDYSVRLSKKNNDEIGLLTDRYNQLLEQLENRDKERDITEEVLKEAKKRAEHSDELKSAFLANMSHEIRTPMNSIIGFVGLLGDSETTKKESRDYLDLINNSCNTLLQLIDDILDISKIEAGQLNINIANFNLTFLLEEMLATFNDLNNKANQSKVKIILDTPKEYSNTILQTDEIRLRQILTNLISNAIKFTNQGSIKIGYTFIEKIKNTKRSRHIKFFVQDTGIGMDQNTQAIIFDRFTKIKPDNNKLYQGTGLGLTISKKLVELLNGEIWVESTLNEGSKFFFTIPYENSSNDLVSSLETQRNTLPLNESYNLSNKNILIVEDEPSNYELLRAMLKKSNAKITWAENGVEAILYCEKNTYDLILMDIKMPEMDGYQTVKKLRQMKINTPVIAQTAYARIEDESKILNSGFNAYISKPIIKGKLLEIIDKHFPESK